MNPVISHISMLCAATLLGVTAHAASLHVGYCNGEVSDSGFSKAGKTSISAAIILHADDLEPYIGAEITGIRIGIATATGLSNLTGWVRNSLEEENLDAATVETPASGWNEATLSRGIKVNGTQLAVGYTFSQEKSVKAISLAGDVHTDGYWLSKYDTKNNCEAWECQLSTIGSVSVELVVTDPRFPGKDIEIKDIDFSSMPVKAGNELDVDVTFRNAALTDIDGFIWGYSIGGVKENMTCDAPLAPQQSITLNCKIPTSSLAPDVIIPLEINVSADGDENPGNDKLTINAGCYTESVPRLVLMEEFTSEECGNCPRAINSIQQCVDNGYSGLFTVVAHHVGYKDDWLTVEEDKDYEWFYDPLGVEGTFAPAGMFDRTVRTGDKVPVRSVGYYKDVAPQLDEAIAVPSFVTVTPLVNYDTESRQLDVTVKAEMLPLFDAISTSPRINVYIVEDGILHHNQAGISSDSFTHNHVYRQRLSDTWGDIVTPVDGMAEKSYSCTLPSEWNADNIEVVAFVSSYNAADVSDCKIHNTGTARITTAGINSPAINRSQPVSVEYFNISGQRISAITGTGLMIRRATYPDGTVEVEKIMR